MSVSDFSFDRAKTPAYRTERELAAVSTWGTGFGSTRHRIGHESGGGIRSACRDGAYRLDYFDADETHRYGAPKPMREYVLAKKPCKICQKMP